MCTEIWNQRRHEWWGRGTQVSPPAQDIRGSPFWRGEGKAGGLQNGDPDSVAEGAMWILGGTKQEVVRESGFQVKR